MSTQSRSRFGLLFLLAGLGASVLPGAPVVVILRSGQNSWSVEEGERIAFNQRDKMRTGAVRGADVSPEEYRRMPAEPILSSGLLRRHAAGFLVRKAGPDWTPVFADGANYKTSAKIADQWQATAVVLYKSRADKAGTSIPAADIFAIVTNKDRNDAIAGLIADETNFRKVGERDERDADRVGPEPGS